MLEFYFYFVFFRFLYGRLYGRLYSWCLHVKWKRQEVARVWCISSLSHLDTFQVSISFEMKLKVIVFKTNKQLIKSVWSVSSCYMNTKQTVFSHPTQLKLRVRRYCKKLFLHSILGVNSNWPKATTTIKKKQKIAANSPELPQIPLISQIEYVEFSLPVVHFSMSAWSTWSATNILKTDLGQAGRKCTTESAVQENHHKEKHLILSRDLNPLTVEKKMQNTNLFDLNEHFKSFIDDL